MELETKHLSSTGLLSHRFTAELASLFARYARFKKKRIETLKRLGWTKLQTSIFHRSALAFDPRLESLPHLHYPPP